MSKLNPEAILHKIGVPNPATELSKVAMACKAMGLSRDTFCRYQNADAEGGEEARFDANRLRFQ